MGEEAPRLVSRCCSSPAEGAVPARLGSPRRHRPRHGQHRLLQRPAKRVLQVTLLLQKSHEVTKYHTGGSEFTTPTAALQTGAFLGPSRMRLACRAGAVHEVAGAAAPLAFDEQLLESDVHALFQEVG